MPVRQVSIENRDSSSDSKSSKWVLNDTRLTRMRELCVARLEAAAADGSLARQPQLTWLLYTWRAWGGLDGPRAFVRQLVETPQGLLRILQGFTQESRHYVIGQPSSRVTRVLRLADLEEFVDAEFLETQVRRAPSASLENQDQLVVDAFWAAKHGRKEGHSEEQKAGGEVPEESTES